MAEELNTHGGGLRASGSNPPGYNRPPSFSRPSSVHGGGVRQQLDETSFTDSYNTDGGTGGAGAGAGAGGMGYEDNLAFPTSSGVGDDDDDAQIRPEYQSRPGSKPDDSRQTSTWAPITLAKLPSSQPGFYHAARMAVKAGKTHQGELTQADMNDMLGYENDVGVDDAYRTMDNTPQKSPTKYANEQPPNSSHTPVARQASTESMAARMSHASPAAMGFAYMTMKGAGGANAARRKTLIAGNKSRTSIKTFGGDRAEESAYKTMKDVDAMKKMVKTQPARMAEKMAAVEEQNELAHEVRLTIPAGTMCWLTFTYALSNAWRTVRNTVMNSGLWRNGIKELEGGHGAHVGVYFRFLRSILFLNLLLALMWGLFVAAPFRIMFGQTPGITDKTNVQLMPNPVDVAGPSVYHPRTTSPAVSETDRLYGVENDWYTPKTEDYVIGLFTGGRPLNHTAYFFGAYFIPYLTGADGVSPYSGEARFGLSEQLQTTPLSDAYHIPMAYFWVGALTIMLSFVWVFGGLHYAYIYNAVSFESGQYKCSEIVFARYDHSLTKPSAIKVHQKDLAERVKEVLGEKAAEEAAAALDMKVVILKRVFLNILMLAILVGSCIGIVYVVEEFLDAAGFIALVPVLVLSLINAVVPIIFEVLGDAEQWQTPLTVIMLTVARSILVRVMTFAMFFRQVFKQQTSYACWESFVGQQFYRVFVVGSLIFEIFTSLGLDILITVAYNKMPCIRGIIKQPAYFDTVKKILELTYAQAIIWFGSFFCPLLPVAGIIRVIVLYYVQKFSTQNFCKPKGTPFQAKHSLPWLIWICFAIHLLMAALPWGYLVSNQAPSGIQHPQNYWFVGNLASDEWVATANGSKGLDASTTTTTTTTTFTTETTTPVADGGGGDEVEVGVGSGEAEADADAAVQVNVDGWCVFPDTAARGDDPHATDAMCTPINGIKTYNYDEVLGRGVWNYDWREAEECQSYQDEGGVSIAGYNPACDSCQELPNYANCSESLYATKGCGACLDPDVDLNEWVCYSPGKSTDFNFFDDPTADDFLAQDNQPHLPHDCGAMVTMRFLCQQCPSGCGPFRNQESMLTYMKEDLETWTDNAAWLVQTISFMGTVTFTVIISLVFLMVYLVMRSKSAARQKQAEKFKTERDMERLDKLWILREYNITFEHQAKLSTSPGPNVPLAMSHNGEFQKTQMSSRQAARGSTVTDIGQF